MSHSSQTKGQNTGGQAGEQLTTTEELEHQKEVKLSELDAKKKAIDAADRQREQVQRLIDTLVKGRQNQILRLSEVNEEEEAARKRTLDERQRLLAGIEAEIRKYSAPLAEGKSHYQLISDRIAMMRKAISQRVQQKQRELAEVRYAQLMVRAKSQEVRCEIEKLMEFVKSRRPHLLPEIEKERASQDMNSNLYDSVVKTKVARVKELRDECWKLQEELARRDSDNQRRDDK
jgi:hypothetical protein